MCGDRAEKYYKRGALMKKIAVIGSGVMGLGIAQTFAQKGFSVVVRDVSEAVLAKAESKVNADLEKLAAKGKIDEACKNSALANMSFSTDINAVSDCDLIIEAIYESAEAKKSLFKELDAVCKPETVFASNTSSISITEIAGATNRADRFIGMHFFNPATVMKLVEVIKGSKTSKETFDAVYGLSKVIGKEPVEVNEAPGFVVNKILITMINEAVCVLSEGVASCEDIDKAMKLGCNHPMGPLELADLIGIDVVLGIMDVLLKETGDSKYRANVLLRKMVRSGNLGRKTKQGFYKYE